MRFFLTFMAVILFASCQHVERPDKPKNLISEDVMVDILTDAYLNNAARSFNNRQLIAVGAKLDSFVYAKHNVDSISFVESNAYYSSNLNEYISIFQKVEERLTKMQEKADTLKVKVLKERAEKKTQDSILKVKKGKDSIEARKAKGLTSNK